MVSSQHKDVLYWIELQPNIIRKILTAGLEAIVTNYEATEEGEYFLWQQSHWPYVSLGNPLNKKSAENILWTQSYNYEFYIGVHNEIGLEMAKKLLDFFNESFPEPKARGKIVLAYVPTDLEELKQRYSK